MHSAVLQNKSYIKFAERNTVEVITCSGIDRAVEEKHAKAETYEVEVGGKKKQYFVEFPGLDLEMLMQLNRSKAPSYNSSGGIPHTSIVDPFTLEKLGESGGSMAAGKLEEMVEAAQKKIREQHGKPKIDRGDLEDIAEAVADADEAIAKDDVKKALRELDKIEKKAEKWPEEAKEPIAAARQRVLDAAEQQIADAEALAQEDPGKAKSLLRILQGKLRGTPLEERVDKALESLSDK